MIATNAHVARGDSDLVALLPGGASLPAFVVYISEDLEGIGFALSSSDLLNMLLRFYPDGI